MSIKSALEVVVYVVSVILVSHRYIILRKTTSKVLNIATNVDH